MDFEAKAYCPACSVGHLVARFHEAPLDPDESLRLPVDGDLEYGIPGSYCHGCHRELILEIEQVGAGAIAWLAGKDPTWVTCYLAGRRAGGSHTDSANAADAVTAPPAG